MPEYNYRAITTSGEKIAGIFEAASKEAVLKMLSEKQSYPVSVEEKTIKDVTEIKFYTKVKTKDIAIFCRQFFSMLNAGVPIVNCLNILRQQTDNKRLRDVLAEVYEEVNKGKTFSNTLKAHPRILPDLLVYMVEAGEVSGNLDIVIERMANHYEKEYKINNKIKAATFYPFILSFVATAAVIFFTGICYAHLCRHV